mmetsp:Transcript_20407/g.38405  ORF Transcript_20407/g.38405 Transcript_20407/m.38405 type:complete len:134 (-) Transcript_20407:134-535(-)
MGYRCRLCNYTASTSQNLKKHNFAHLGIQPHTCNICGRRFTEKGNINRHVLGHMGRQTQNCSLCCRTFVSRDNLRRHVRDYHPQFCRNGTILNELLYRTPPCADPQKWKEIEPSNTTSTASSSDAGVVQICFR